MALFLRALKGEICERPPVWLMRQAGRCLPSYRKLRERYSLEELFSSPELAAEVTLLPMQEIDPDAAILFSDILVVVKALGMKVHFPEKEGPRVVPSLEKPEEIDLLRALPAKMVLGHVKESILLIKKRLKKPLIGFCGGPFTVASYMIDQGQRGDPKKTLRWLYSDPKRFHHLLNLITEISIQYLQMQIDGGVDAIQIFDSWAGSLAYQPFREFSLRYLQKMGAALKERGVPWILFCRGSCLRVEELVEISPSAISFDWQLPIRKLRDQVPNSIAVQGNVDPHLLLSSPEVIRKEMGEILRSMKGFSNFIVNLGHGVLPDTPLENVRTFVECVKSSTPEYALN